MSSKGIKFLPEGRAHGGVLPWVIAVMTFLAAVALATSFAVFNMSTQWTSDLSNVVTVQVAAENNDTRDKQVEDVLTYLRGVPGIESATALSRAEVEALLEPWLGVGNVTEDLPVPAMISVQLEEDRFIDLTGLDAQLKAIAPQANVDDHQQWLAQLSNLSRTFQWGALAAVLLIILTTIAIIVFATHARLTSHNDSIEIIHLIGAEDKIIAREFRYRFMLYGLKGGILGALLAFALLLTIKTFVEDMGADLLVEISLSTSQYITMALLPVATALLSLFTTDIAVKRALSKMV